MSAEGPPGFNEAAAFAAEQPHWCFPRTLSARGFNEAAAFAAEQRADGPRAQLGDQGFNEAAAFAAEQPEIGSTRAHLRSVWLQ